MPFHDVIAGETLLGLASKNGLDSWEDIVNAPENASIKDTLTDPGIVKTGAKIFIPNKTMKQDPGEVDKTHTFGVKRPKAWLRVALKDADGTALASKNYTLTVDGKNISGTTAADGLIEQAVAIDATSGKLVVWLDDTTSQEWELKLGWIDPISEISGVQARLTNLGFDCGAEPSGTLDDATKDAVRAFQARVGMEVTGEIDDALREKLKSYYDPAQDETGLDAQS